MVVLAWRELLHFFRQPLRLLGSLAQPLMLWLLMGSGFAESFRPASDDLNYSEFFYPGIVLMLLLFAGIFSTITLIEDRSAGFLQGVMVAPVSSLSLVLGKLVGGSAIALIQSVVFLLLAPLAGFDLSLDMVLHLVLLFALAMPLAVLVFWVVRGVSAGEPFLVSWLPALNALYVSCLAAAAATAAGLPVFSMTAAGTLPNRNSIATALRRAAPRPGGLSKCITGKLAGPSTSAGRTTALPPAPTR